MVPSRVLEWCDFIFHLSRLEWEEKLDGDTLLTHHLNGCYEYQKMMMFNMMMTTDPDVHCWAQIVRILDLFFWQKSIKTYFASWKAFISSFTWSDFPQQLFKSFIDSSSASLAIRVSFALKSSTLENPNCFPTKVAFIQLLESSHESCGWGQREGEKHLVTLGEIASLIFSACLPNDMIKQSRMFFISLQTKSFFKECRALLFVDISRQHGYMRREANDKSFMVFRCTFIIGSYRSLFN